MLLVPNAALRWSAAARVRSRPTRGKGRATGGRRRGSGPGGERALAIWIEEGRFVRPIARHAGLTDGALTEVEGKGLTEGLPVVIGEGVR